MKTLILCALLVVSAFAEPSIDLKNSTVPEAPSTGTNLTAFLNTQLVATVGSFNAGVLQSATRPVSTPKLSVEGGDVPLPVGPTIPPNPWDDDPCRGCCPLIIWFLC